MGKWQKARVRDWYLKGVGVWGERGNGSPDWI